MSKSIFVPAALAASLAMSLGLAAAGSAAADTTVSFLHKWPEPENMAYFDAAVKAFEEANPGISVDMQAVADEPYKDKIRVLMGSKQVPDVFFSWSGEFGKKFARNGRVMDLTEAVLGTDWKDEFPEAALEPFEYQGKLYGVPQNVNAKFMLYNRKIFADNDIEVPKTLEDLIAACGTLKDAGVVPIAFGNQFPWAASHYLGDLIGKNVPDATRQADFELSSPEDELYTDPGYLQALEEFEAMNEAGCFNRGSNALTHPIARGSFTAGRAAMMYMELTEFAQVKGTQLESDGWDFFPLPAPADAKGDTGLLTGAPDGFMVSADTAHPDEAIAFLKFLTSPGQAAGYATVTGMTAAVKGSVNDSNADPKTLKGLGMLDQASGMALWLDTDMDARSTEVLLAGAQAMLNGDETPEAVLENVQETAKQVSEERAAQ